MPSGKSEWARAALVRARIGSRIVAEAVLELGAKLSVGTAAESGLVIDEPTVSRRHLELEVAPGGVQVSDLGSTNGTRVRGKRISKELLPLPSVLLVGDVELKLDAAEQPARARLGELDSVSPPMVEAIAVLKRPFKAPILLEAEEGAGDVEAARCVAPGGELEVVECAKINNKRAAVFTKKTTRTLFLSAVHTLPDLMQLMLAKTLAPDARLVSSTSVNLQAEVEARRFDAGLFTTLSKVRVRLPPLRERPDDIALLVQRTLDEIGRKTCGFQPDRSTLVALQAYRWPLNVRELDVLIERALALSADVGPVDGEALGLTVDSPIELLVHETRAARERVRLELERDFLVHLLTRFDGNVNKVAAEAGSDRAHVQRLVKKHRVTTERAPTKA